MRGYRNLWARQNLDFAESDYTNESGVHFVVWNEEETVHTLPRTRDREAQLKLGFVGANYRIQIIKSTN